MTGDRESRLKLAYDLIADRIPSRAKPSFEEAWRALRTGLAELWDTGTAANANGSPDAATVDQEPHDRPTSPGRESDTSPSRERPRAGPGPMSPAPVDLSEVVEPELAPRILRIYPEIQEDAVRAVRDHWLAEDGIRRALQEHARARRFRVTPEPGAVAIEDVVRGWGLKARLLTTFEGRSTRTRKEPYQGQSLSGPVLEGLWERSPLDANATWRRRGSEKIELCSACRGQGKLECEDCQGVGRIDAACPHCHGSGRFQAVGGTADAPECPECSGSGRAARPCTSCSEKGQIACGACAGNGSILVFQEICSEVRTIEREEFYAPDGVEETWAAEAGGVRLPERGWQRPGVSLGLTAAGDEIATRQDLSASVIPLTGATLRFEFEAGKDDTEAAETPEELSTDAEAEATGPAPDGARADGPPPATRDAPGGTRVWFVGVGAPIYGSLNWPLDRRKVGLAVGAIAALTLAAVLIVLAL